MDTMLPIMMGVLGVGAVGFLVWRLLNTATSRGGAHPGDAATHLAQVNAQAAAFRGDASGEAWDGVDRLKALPGDPGGATGL